MKDGWNQTEDDGWLVSSAGVVLPPQGGGEGEPYSIAVLSEGQESFEGGVELIEQISRATHEAFSKGSTARR